MASKDEKGFTAGSYPGIIHHYSSFLTAFEYTTSATTQSGSKSILLFIPGLGDGLLHPFYASLLPDMLPPGWSLVQPVLSSSYSGWGISDLNRDVEDLNLCLQYLIAKLDPTNIVLMGHSTGCQDVMHYLTGPGRDNLPKIQGAILQASVSDREAMNMLAGPETIQKSVMFAEKMVEEGRGKDLLPLKITGGFFPAPCSADRWLSLASPQKDGLDDMFSSDLTDEQLEKTFGVVGETKVPLCVLYSAEDEYAPKTVDKAELVRRWAEIVKGRGGVVDEVNTGLVLGASHSLVGDKQEVVQSLLTRVVSFLKRVDDGDFKAGRKA